MWKRLLSELLTDLMVDQAQIARILTGISVVTDTIIERMNDHQERILVLEHSQDNLIIVDNDDDKEIVVSEGSRDRRK